MIRRSWEMPICLCCKRLFCCKNVFKVRMTYKLPIRSHLKKCNTCYTLCYVSLHFAVATDCIAINYGNVYQDVTHVTVVTLSSECR